jgi:hypothetical protein
MRGFCEWQQQAKTGHEAILPPSADIFMKFW